ncbi:MAG: hypothetical protein GC162_08450 [Planctomycetes bacterium]|nr:hypothetical protein [Planctomycetota bacterium]
MYVVVRDAAGEVRGVWVMFRFSFLTFRVTTQVKWDDAADIADPFGVGDRINTFKTIKAPTRNGSARGGVGEVRW